MVTATLSPGLDPDDFDPEYYAQVIVRATEDSGTGEWTFLALVIQPDGIYLREWNADVVTELGGVAVPIPNNQWHDVTIQLSGGHVSVRQALNGSGETQSIEADTTIAGAAGQFVGFGVGEKAQFRFDDVGTDLPVPASVALRYHYDAYGRVVGRTLDPEGTPDSQFYIYDNDRIVQELDENGAVVAEWVYGSYIDELVAMYRDTDGDGTIEPATETYYYLQDDLYNVVALTDANGAIVERYSYDDFGAPTVWNETAPGSGTWVEHTGVGGAPVSNFGNPFLFTGRRWDEVLQLYDYRTRYYDPALGRFLRIDTIGPWGDTNNLGNPYTYVGNNPWSNLDPYGETGGILHWLYDVGRGPRWAINEGKYVSYFARKKNKASAQRPDISMEIRSGTGAAGLLNGEPNAQIPGQSAPGYDAARAFAQDTAIDAAGDSIAVGSVVITGPAGVLIDAGYIAVDASDGKLDPLNTTLTVIGMAGTLRGSNALGKEARVLDAAIPTGGVYVLRDPVTNRVMRTGRTKDLGRRAAEHARDPELKGLVFEIVERTDDYAEQRGLEQILYTEHKPPLNRIRPIDPANPKHEEYLEAAAGYLERNKK